MGGLSYKDSGVDTELARRIPERLLRHTSRSRQAWVEGGLGGFASVIDLAKTGMGRKGIVKGRLALTCDGVGTKVMLASRDGDFEGLGQDAVAMCVNDLLVVGAEPLAVLDYVATGKIGEERLESLVGGIARACAETGCSLVGGETAEMPGLYGEDEWDVACFAVGLVREDVRVDGEDVKEGDRVIGLRSSGLHSNGFSLVRKVVERWGGRLDERVPFGGEEKSLREVLLTPTRLYCSEVLEGWLSKENKEKVRLMAHVTGGGLGENLSRGLREGVGCVLSRGSWEEDEVFLWLREVGGIEEEEMERTFNCGIGYVGVVRGEDFCESEWGEAVVLGYVEKDADGGVRWV